MVGIAAFGAYVPRLRMQRDAMAQATAWFNPGLAALSVGERSLASWDEDTVTMALEAARDCLGDRDRSPLAKVILASTTLPFADRQNAGIVKEALNLPDEVGTLDIAGSQRAGTSALLAALDSARTGRPVLCLAAEQALAPPASEAEFINGDAAAAVLVDTDEVIAEFIGSHSTSVDFVDHFRAAGHAHDYVWESRWIRDEGHCKLLPAALVAALAKFDIEPAAIDHLILPLAASSTATAVASTAGIRAETVCESLRNTLGYAGSAHPLLLLAQRLETAKPGSLILLASFGQGCDVLLFRATPNISRRSTALGVGGWLARRQPERNYLKHLYFAGEVELAGGMRSEIELKTPLSMLYRERKSILSLVGGRCRQTGAVQYPKTRIAAVQQARMIDTQEDYPLADLRAHAISATADHLSFTPDPPSWYGMVEFEGGGRLMVDFADVGPNGIAAGDAVRMMFRLKRSDTRGFKQYYWKAVPDYRPAG